MHVHVYLTLLQARWRAVLLLISTKDRSGFALCSKNSEVQKKRDKQAFGSNGVFTWSYIKCIK